MTRGTFGFALVQIQWHPDSAVHCAEIETGIARAVKAGADIVALPELTLSPYFAATTGRQAAAARFQEPLRSGPTATMFSALSRHHRVHIIASLYENGGYNTAVIFDPNGSLVGACRKQHIPGSDGYAEQQYFRSAGSAQDYPVFTLALPSGPVRVAVPTCYDQWFPELHRIYALRGAELLVFPSAIGAERSAPGLDTSDTWQLCMRGSAVANGTFVAAINRVTAPAGAVEPGAMGGQAFFGRSFICGPDGAVMADAGSDEARSEVVRIDLDEVRRWRELFPLLRCRRPAEYGPLLHGEDEDDSGSSASADAGAGTGRYQRQRSAKL